MKRLLTGKELAKLDLVDQSIAASVLVRTSRLLPRQADGMTIGKTIIVRPESEHSMTLLAHELVHVEQWHTQGRAKFLSRYLTAYAKNLTRLRSHRLAYLAIPAEEEARRRTEAWKAQRELT